MRLVSLIPAVLALFFANAACAQEWDEYVNRENFFTVNFPGEPTMQQIPYATAKGTKLTVRVFTAKADPNSILAGTYSMTVVDYASAPTQLGTAIEETAKVARARGAPKYDEPGNVDRIKSRVASQVVAVRTPEQHAYALTRFGAAVSAARRRLVPPAGLEPARPQRQQIFELVATSYAERGFLLGE
jgi:hypothetical protein